MHPARSASRADAAFSARCLSMVDGAHPAFAAFATMLVRIAAPLVPARPAMARLAAASAVRAADKGEHLLRAGEPAGHVFFVAGGLLRYYYLDGACGDERTGQFFEPGQMITDVASFVTGAPATQSIQALGASEVVAVPRAAMLAAYAEDHAVERSGRLLIEAALVGAQRRAALLLTETPEARYAAFVAARPEVARRLPQYLIASYLGITPEALSRIRGRRALRP